MWFTTYIRLHLGLGLPRPRTILMAIPLSPSHVIVEVLRTMAIATDATATANTKINTDVTRKKCEVGHVSDPQHLSMVAVLPSEASAEEG